MGKKKKKNSTLWRMDDDGTLHLDFHSGQLRTWDSKGRFVFMLAGTQGGKTSFGPWWLYREIMEGGGGDYLAVTSTYDLFKLKMLPEMLTVYESVLKIGRYWAGSGIIEIRDPETGKFKAERGTDPMWARIILRSASSEGGLESATALAAWLDEVGQPTFSLEAWEAVLRRLSLSQGRVLGTTTLYGGGWLKQQIYDPWLKGEQDIDVVQFASVQNPLFPKEEFDRARATMPTWKFRLFYLGEFDTPPGLIYSDYDETVHMISPRPLPKHWNRYVGIDPGAVNEWALWIAEDPILHVFYVYRETHLGGMTTREKSALLKDYMDAENVITIVGGAPGEVQYRTDMNDAGIPVMQPPISDVEAGIDRVISLFKQNKLYVFETMKGLRDELARYSRKLAPDGTVLDEIQDKSSFHRLDALRYLATVLDVGGIVANFDKDGSLDEEEDPWGVLKRATEFS